MFHVASTVSPAMRCCVVASNAALASTSYANTTIHGRVRRAHTSRGHRETKLSRRRRRGRRQVVAVAAAADVNATDSRDDEKKDASWKSVQNKYAAWRVENNILAPNVEVAHVGGGGGGETCTPVDL